MQYEFGLYIAVYLLIDLLGGHAVFGKIRVIILARLSSGGDKVVCYDGVIILILLFGVFKDLAARIKLAPKILADLVQHAVSGYFGKILTEIYLILVNGFIFSAAEL